MACMFKSCNEELGDVKLVNQVNSNVQIFFQVATIEVDRNHESWTETMSLGQEPLRCLSLFLLVVIFSI